MSEVFIPLADLEFASIINSQRATTNSGRNLLNKYRSFLMENECSCSVVNNFVKEANQLKYDSTVNAILETVCEHINLNKISWQLASACEEVNRNNSSFNYLNRNAAKQVCDLLENKSEEDVVKYIKAGALKNIMYCESFRNIIRSVYSDQQTIITDDYTAFHPISFIEENNNNVYFEVLGRIYKLSDDMIIESSAKEVSPEFLECSRLIESNLAKFEKGVLYIDVENAEYIIEEKDCDGKACRTCTKKNKKKAAVEEQVFTNVDDIREHNDLVISSINPKRRSQVEVQLEAIAKCFENFEKFVILDNTSIVSGNGKRFLVIENNTNMYAMSLDSTNYSNAWKVNCDVNEAISFIRGKTSINISKDYEENIEKSYDNISEQKKQQIAESLKNEAIESRKRKIEALTERYKYEPEKLAILSKVADQLNNI